MLFICLFVDLFFFSRAIAHYDAFEDNKLRICLFMQW